MKRFFFVLLMMACSASQAEWEFSGSAGGGKILSYYDKSTIRRSGVIAKMWKMKDFTTVQIEKNGDRKKSEKAFTAYNCKEETWALMTLVQYSESMGEGDVIWSYTWKEHEMNWIPNVPDTIGEIEWKIACGKK
jgi:hypothetical protein